MNPTETIFVRKSLLSFRYGEKTSPHGVIGLRMLFILGFLVGVLPSVSAQSSSMTTTATSAEKTEAPCSPISRCRTKEYSTSRAIRPASVTLKILFNLR